MIAVSTTIKIKKKTLSMLTRIIGELTIKLGRKISYDEAIQHLIERYYRKLNSEKSDEATKILLSMIENPQPCGGPEDLREYDYDDIGE